MQTFSKAFGLAAVRVGIAFADPAVVHYFNKVKPPYNISTVNQKAVLKKLEREDEYRDQVQTIKLERERLADTLKKTVLRKKSILRMPISCLSRSRMPSTCITHLLKGI